MPVRIYDIAKKLGIESKDVLAKAKELGITGAKVPSSSLDKITAEFLEEQLGGKPVAPPLRTPPAPEPVIIVSPPAPEAKLPLPASAQPTPAADSVPTLAPAASVDIATAPAPP